MLRNHIFSVSFIIIYLFIYFILIQFEATLRYGFLMLSLSPVLVSWMVYTILKYGEYKGKELGEDEYGYADKNKEELGIF